MTLTYGKVRCPDSIAYVPQQVFGNLMKKATLISIFRFNYCIAHLREKNLNGVSILTIVGDLNRFLSSLSYTKFYSIFPNFSKAKIWKQSCDQSIKLGISSYHVNVLLFMILHLPLWWSCTLTNWIRSTMNYQPKLINLSLTFVFQ